MSIIINNKSVLTAIIKGPADQSENDTLTAIVNRFWEIEELTSSKPTSLPEGLQCKQLTNKNWTRLGNRQYSVCPFSNLGF